MGARALCSAACIAGGTAPVTHFTSPGVVPIPDPFLPLNQPVLPNLVPPPPQGVFCAAISPSQAWSNSSTIPALIPP